ncbi:MAG TPA: hypothetical protein VHL77_10415 [Ferruginibacter sp.]|nr:hypothetical protein [Ferruginibacter sp.]
MNTENIIFLLVLACAALMVIGLISPKTALFWYRHEKTRKRSLQVYGLFLVTLIIILGLLLTA